jgi:hypothetical protein
MIKTLIIFILLLALLVGAALSRPSFDSFKAWHRSRQKSPSGNLIEKVVEETYVSGYLAECKYKNRLLWADIENNGQVVATGAFTRWFARGTESGQTKPAATP